MNFLNIYFALFFSQTVAVKHNNFTHTGTLDIPTQDLLTFTVRLLDDEFSGNNNSVALGI